MGGKSDDESGSKGGQSDRRGFFRLGGEKMRGSLIDMIKAFSDAAEDLADAVEAEERKSRRPPRIAARPFVRPPGALSEAPFLETCERTHECVEACPFAAILPGDPYMPKQLAGTPIIRPELEACHMCEDVPCAAACPSGALRPVPPEKIRIGLVRVFPNLCLNTHGHVCKTCYDQCPLPGQAITVQAKGALPEINPEYCTGCGLCVLHCPSQPRALHLRPL